MNTPPETLDELSAFATRSDESTRKAAQAFARLLQLAETRNSGQIPRIARFIAATYNGHAFPSCSSEHDANNAKRRLMRTRL